MNTYSSVNRLLGIDYPIVQGPFGGGLSTTELVATVSNAGGLGSYGAHMLEAAHVDAVVVTGFEAGGHRPSFLKAAEDSLHGTFALIPVVKDRVRIPIIAAGGIADLRGVNAALALGADAVQLGTAFLACAESGASSSHKAMLHSRGPMDTVLSRAFTGRLARFRENRAIREFESSALPALPFPAQSDLMAPLKRRAAELGNIDYQSLYASQTSALVRHRSAAALMEALKPAFTSPISTIRK